MQQYVAKITDFRLQSSRLVTTNQTRIIDEKLTSNKFQYFDIVSSQRNDSH